MHINNTCKPPGCISGLLGTVQVIHSLLPVSSFIIHLSISCYRLIKWRALSQEMLCM